MDCNTALRMLEMYRPSREDSADAELALAIAHVDQCPSCRTQVQARHSFDTRVAATMQEVPVPPDLRNRIHCRLNASSVPRRRSLLRIARFALGAAAVVLVSALVILWPPPKQSPIAIDWKSLGEVAILDLGEVEELRETPSNLADQGGVQHWCSRQLTQLKLVGPLPSGWPLIGLTGIGRTSIEGRRVAVFRFEDSRGESEIIALPHDKFRIGDLGKGTRLVTHTRNLVVIAWDEQDTSYVAVLKDWAPKDWKQLVTSSNELI